MNMDYKSMAWVPAHISADDYIVELDPQGVVEVMGAVRRFNSLGRDGDGVNAAGFELPIVGRLLAWASSQVHSGRGFCVVRGLDPNSLSNEDNLISFLGISSHVGGDLRGVQDKHGNMIVHVTDSKSWLVAPEKRHGIHTSIGLPFHTDMGASVLALHVRQSAQAGGDTFLASAATIFHELKTRYPNVAKTLMEPQWPIQISGRPPRHILVPLVQEHEGKVMMALDPGRLGVYNGHLMNHANNRLDGAIPELSSAQLHAFKVLNELAQAHSLRLELQTGDMLFINNWALLHARDKYVDGDSSRHLVRLWLHNTKKGWAIPKALGVPWEAAFGVDGNGRTSRSKGRRIYAVVPPVEYKVPRYAAGSAAFLMEDEDV